MSNSWRNLCFVLGAACSWQAWRACHRRPPPAATADGKDCVDDSSHTVVHHNSETMRDREGDDTESPLPVQTGDGPTFYGVKVPGWAMALTPRPGEDLRSYRDRMLPLAQMAVAPQRARIARSSDDFAKLAGLDTHQRAELEAAAKETATAIQDRLFNAALGGELSPSTFKPMTGVSVARDILELIDRANKRFVGTLSEDQRAKLAQHPFDFADYLLFSTKWEDAISGL